MKRIGFSAALIAISAAVLVACGSGDTVPIQAATSNVAANATPANTAPLVGATFTAATGVPALGTTAATTIAISGTAAAQVATVTSGTQRAVTRLTYGSCIFTVTESNFPADHPLALGKTVTVNPCNVTVTTAGTVVDAPASAKTVGLQLGATSATTQLPVVVNANGTATIGGVVVGGVTLGNVTGG